MKHAKRKTQNSAMCKQFANRYDSGFSTYSVADTQILEDRQATRAEPFPFLFL
jgi:hypothetical protein